MTDLNIPGVPESSTISKAAVAAQQLVDRYSNYGPDYGVKDQLEFDMAVQDMRALKAMIDTVEASRKSITGPRNDEIRTINATFAAIAEPVETLLERVRRATVAYTTEQRRISQEAARKAQELAAKKQRRLEEEAAAAREAGKEARADILEERAASVVSEAPAPPPKAAGVSNRVVWKFAVDHPELVPIEYRTIDEGKIGAVVRALKNASNIPGVRVWSEDAISIRGAK